MIQGEKEPIDNVLYAAACGIKNTKIMTQEEKQLLLKDLCARLPYGIETSLTDGTSGMITSISIVPHGIFVTVYFDRDNVEDVSLENIKPYLRPMSSMTEEEMQEYVIVWDSRKPYMPTEAMDWLNAHHFDYRGLIPMGLAIEAPEKMYES